MQTSLRGIAEKSALHKDHRFQNLMGLIGPEKRPKQLEMVFMRAEAPKRIILGNPVR